MVEGKCIYCREIKELNEEHAFPEDSIAKMHSIGQVCTRVGNSQVMCRM